MKYVKQFLKKTLPIGLLYFSLVAHADETNSCYHWSVYSEPPAYAVDLEFRALFLKPSANNLYFAVEALPFDPNAPDPILSPRWTIFDFHPDYHCGFDVGFTAVIPSRASNVSVNWEHFSSDTCAAHKVVDTQNMIGPFSSIGPDAGQYKQVNARVAFDFDEVNARYGQFVHFGSYLSTNLFAGIGFARLKQCMRTIFSDSGAGISRTFLVPTSFMGAGPELGFDAAYEIYAGLRLTGQFVAALLVGNMKNHSTYLSESPELAILGETSPNVQGTTVQCRTQMVPVFIERLGLAYVFCFCEERYQVQIEVGFEGKILLNAIQTTDLNSGVVGVGPINSTVGVYARTYDRNLGNFALHGFYIALDGTF